VSQTLDKGYFALDKAFVECYTRQSLLDKHFIDKGLFAEYFFRSLGKDFAECRKTLGKLRIINKTQKPAKQFLN
jgi:hypothetical protein